MSKSSLPPKPPLPTGPQPQISSSAGYPSYSAPLQQSIAFPSAFGSFQPRQLASPQSWQVTPNISARPTHFAGQSSVIGPSYGSPYPQAAPPSSTWQSSTPAPSSSSSIRNPFQPPAQFESAPTYNQPYSTAFQSQSAAVADPEYAQQIAQWQSAYAGADAPEVQKGGKSGFTTKSWNNGVEGAGSASGANNAPLGQRADGIVPVAAPSTHGKDESQIKHYPAPNPNHEGKTVVREGGGQTWSDSTLLDWDPAHLRMFVGNLAGEVTDDSLLKAFAKYSSVQKARVIRDKRTTKSKGFGFVSFSDGEDFFAAAKEMQGKYIGSHPVLLKRATTEVRPTNITPKGARGRNGRNLGGGRKDGILGADTGSGVEKRRLPKTKGGLPLLG